jgi:hypothetical protein
MNSNSLFVWYNDKPYFLVNKCICGRQLMHSLSSNKTEHLPDLSVNCFKPTKDQIFKAKNILEYNFHCKLIDNLTYIEILNKLNEKEI